MHGASKLLFGTFSTVAPESVILAVPFRRLLDYIERKSLSPEDQYFPKDALLAQILILKLSKEPFLEKYHLYDLKGSF